MLFAHLVCLFRCICDLCAVHLHAHLYNYLKINSSIPSCMTLLWNTTSLCQDSKTGPDFIISLSLLLFAGVVTWQQRLSQTVKNFHWSSFEESLRHRVIFWFLVSWFQWYTFLLLLLKFACINLKRYFFMVMLSCLWHLTFFCNICRFETFPFASQLNSKRQVT